MFDSHRCITYSSVEMVLEERETRSEVIWNERGAEVGIPKRWNMTGFTRDWTYCTPALTIATVKHLPRHSSYVGTWRCLPCFRASVHADRLRVRQLPCGR